MRRWGWMPIAVGLALLCAACGGLAGAVSAVLLPLAVPMEPASVPSAMSMMATVPASSSCSPMEPSSSPYCDKEVLLAARDTLRGANTEVLRTWQRHNPLGLFEGVRVSPTSGRVVAIEDAWPTFLTGSIPKSLGQLGQLQVLDLGGNGLTGPIPPELGQLSQLQELRMGHNQLTGPIPADLGRVGQLQVLDLTDNRLTGAVPSDLGRLSRLQVLDLSYNRLTGPIPPDLSRLGQLQSLDLSRNQLTGVIPPDLSWLDQLQSLNLGVNRLTGTIPAELGQFGQLHALDLGYNRLTGPIPPDLGRLSQLEWLSLYHNRLMGPIPPELGQLRNLQSLDLRYNWLTGPIPPDLDRLGQLQVLDLRYNQLTCAVPSELGQLGQLEWLGLSGNRLTGSIPPELGQLGQLVWLGLDRNRLTGVIPPELGQLSQLQSLDLDYNRLTGPILPELARFRLDLNQFQDAIPPEPGQPHQLGIPAAAGAYTNQAEHWEGQYRVRRRGQQVTVTLAVHRSPVGHDAPRQPLFRLPEGYRPVLPVTWATVARPVTAQGRPLPEAPAVTVLLEARPDGTVHLEDAPTLDGAGYVGYHTAMAWMTDDTVLLLAGDFTTAAGTGTYRLVRLGDIVTATLAVPVADSSAVGASPPLFTVPVGFRPLMETTWTGRTVASASGTEPREAIQSTFDLRVHRDGRVTHVGPPHPAGHVATAVWQTGDPGWMETRGAYTSDDGAGMGTYFLRRDGAQVTATVTGQHEVSPASVLFTVPAGFRPAQTVHQPAVVDAASCHTATLEVWPEGTVRLIVGIDDEPLVYETTMTWIAGADV